MKIEKGPGWDWAVHCEWEDGTTDVVSVFGQLKIEDVIREARYSLDGTDLGYAILRAERLAA
jgi:hypothetical protein